MLSFEKSMPPSLSELKVTPSFCFAFKIPDNVAASNIYGQNTQLIFFLKSMPPSLSELKVTPSFSSTLLAVIILFTSYGHVVRDFESEAKTR